MVRCLFCLYCLFVNFDCSVLFTLLVCLFVLFVLRVFVRFACVCTLLFVFVVSIVSVFTVLQHGQLVKQTMKQKQNMHTTSTLSAGDETVLKPKKKTGGESKTVMEPNQSRLGPHRPQQSCHHHSP